MQEDGLAGLTDAARAAVRDADIIFGGPRHLMLAGAGERGREWPRPFSVAPVLEARGQRVVVLASGDPLHHGAGGSLAAHLDPGEWRSLPAPSTFSLVANRLGWPLEGCLCRALHAAPPETVAGDLTTGARLIALMRDGAAVHEFARWLDGRDIIARLTVCERLGGPAEHVRPYDPAASYDAPVSLAVEVAQADAPSPAPGRPVELYRHDGQITKPQLRAITLAALAPRAGEMLWDLGAGSGSVAVEWCRLGGHAVAVEARADRAAAIAANIAYFGLQGRMRVVTADHAAAIPCLPRPDAVFVGGGFSRALFDAIRRHAPHARLTVNAVTLETEHLLASLHAHHGGQLLRVEIAQARPLGRGHGWAPTRPVVQWSLP